MLDLTKPLVMEPGLAPQLDGMDREPIPAGADLSVHSVGTKKAGKPQPCEG